MVCVFFRTVDITMSKNVVRPFCTHRIIIARMPGFYVNWCLQNTIVITSVHYNRAFLWVWKWKYTYNPNIRGWVCAQKVSTHNNILQTDNAQLMDSDHLLLPHIGIMLIICTGAASLFDDFKFARSLAFFQKIHAYLKSNIGNASYICPVPTVISLKNKNGLPHIGHKKSEWSFVDWITRCHRHKKNVQSDYNVPYYLL